MPANTRLFVCVVFCAALCTSCVNTRKSTYFNQEGDAVFADTLSIPSTIIQKNDLLSINVSSVNPELSAPFNMPTGSYVNTTNYNGAPIAAAGYLVNADGNIVFPVLGIIRTEGLTELQLQDRIVRTLVDRKLLIDPIVTIRHLNLR